MSEKKNEGITINELVMAVAITSIIFVVFGSMIVGAAYQQGLTKCEESNEKRARIYML